jgi:adenosylcobyric acid synthase
VGILEERTGSHCFGVFPHVSDLHLDAEDSLALDTRPRTTPPRGARIAIVRLPHLSNATDFRQLTWADWLTSPPAGEYDFVILPGTKSTIADLEWLRQVGLAEWIVARHARGATIVGICGGYQMLGRDVADPTAVESDRTSAQGLGLLAASTVLTREKHTRVVRATTAGGVTFGGYEIHLGETRLADEAEATPFATIEEGGLDGACRRGIIGTYLHGALEDVDVCREVFGVELPSTPAKAAHYDRLADWLEEYGRELGRLGFAAGDPTG